jgi:hypothetical protein
MSTVPVRNHEVPGNAYQLGALVFTVALGSLFFFDTFWIYMALICWVIVAAPVVAATNGLTVDNRSLLDYIPLLMVVSWLYGAIVGTVSGVDLSLVFRNFFGMTIYCLYPVFAFWFRDRKQVLRFIWYCALASATLLTIFIVDSLYDINFGEGGDFDRTQAFEEIGLHSFRLHYASNSFFLLAGLLLVIPRARENSGLSRISTPIAWLLIAWFLGLYLSSLSKGFLLALLMLVAACLLTRKSGRIWIAAVAVPLGIVLLVNVDWQSWSTLLFGDEFSGRSARSEQYEYLMSDLTLFGHGLGAALSNSPYSRDTLGYGFELTYLNLIHKFGVFSLVIFGALAYTVLVALVLLTSRSPKRRLTGAIGLTLMLYLVVSVGNPIMFSPIGVVSHMLVVLLMKRQLQEES